MSDRRRGPGRIGTRALALVALLLTACTHRAPVPDYRTAELPVLAVLPAPSPRMDVADRSLAGAELVATVLEAMSPALPIRDVGSLVGRAGAEGACLLEPDRDPGCLSKLYHGPWIEVAADRDRLALTLHPGGDASERPLPALPVDLAVEQAAQALQSALQLPIAPPPRDPADLPGPQTGVCLAEPALAPLGTGARALLRLRLLTGDAADAARTSAIARLEAAYAAAPTLFSAAWLARARLETGDAAGAVQLLPDPMPSRCGVSLAQATRGRARIEQGDQAPGVADLGLSAVRRPFDDEALYDWARGLILEERLPDASQVLRRALALVPGDLEYRRRLADVLTTDGRATEARAVLIQGLEHVRDPEGQAWIELDLAQLDEADDAWQKALLHDQRALQLLGDGGDPGLRASLLNGQGVALLELGQLEPAGRALEKAVAMRRTQAEAGDPDLRERLATSLYNLGTVQAREKRWDAARETLEEAAGLQSGVAAGATRVDLARFLQQGGQAKAALEVLARAKQDVSLDPLLEADWIYIHGLASAGSGQLLSGIEEVEKAARTYHALNEPMAEGLAWFNLAVVAEKVGLSARARAGLDTARDIAERLGDRSSVEEIDRRLEALSAVDVP